MATETKTTAEVVVNASAKVVSFILAVVAAGVATVSKKRALAEGVRAEADRQGYDRKQASQMVALSWLAAFKMDTAPEAQRNAFLLKSRPDISKVIALAYPAKPTELAAAYAHNDKLKDGARSERIGENTLLEIARGNMTAKQAIAGKAQKKAASKLDSVLTPLQRFQNSIAGVLAMHKVGADNGISIDDARNAMIAQVEAYGSKASK